MASLNDKRRRVDTSVALKKQKSVIKIDDKENQNVNIAQAKKVAPVKPAVKSSVLKAAKPTVSNPNQQCRSFPTTLQKKISQKLNTSTGTKPPTTRQTSVICPTCNSRLSFDKYLQHAASCYFNACNELNIQPMCTCSGCKGVRIHPEDLSPFDIVPLDVLRLILAPFQNNEESFFVGLVCSQWNSIIKRTKTITLELLLIKYSFYNNIKALYRLKSYSNNFKVNTKSMLVAAENGNLNTVKWLVENNCPWSFDIFNAAIQKGHYELVKYLHKQGCPWSESCSITAAKYGHLDILQYLYENKCPWNSKCYEAAKATSQSHILAWIQKMATIKIEKYILQWMNGMAIFKEGNYPILDYDSDSDNSDWEENEEEEEEMKSKVSNWAKKEEMEEALQRQKFIDPDSIFHEMKDCNLDEFFGEKKKRRKDLNDSDWRLPVPSEAEKQLYRIQMAFI